MSEGTESWMITVREAQAGDGAALARMTLENAAYYVGLAPDDFRVPDEDGLAEFLDPTQESKWENGMGYRKRSFVFRKRLDRND